MANYSYDEEGSTFPYFLLTVLLCGLVWPTWSWIAGLVGQEGVNKGDRVVVEGPMGGFITGECDCTICQEKGVKVQKERRKDKVITKRLLGITVGWAVFALVLVQVIKHPVGTGISAFDPYEILGLAQGSNEKVVKKHYRKLTLTYHPDKVKNLMNQTREEIESKFVQLTKAYKALTDEVTRKNYEEYGHPDGRRDVSSGIALPSWIVQGKVRGLTLALYTLAFGLLLPLAVGRWWYGARVFTKDGLLIQSANTFFLKLNEDSDYDQILRTMSAADEYIKTKPSTDDMARIAELAEKVKALWKERYHANLTFSVGALTPSAYRAYILMYAHLLRLPIGTSALQKEAEAVPKIALQVLPGLLQMALGRHWLTTAKRIMDLSASFVQAVPPQGPFLMQLPYFDYSLARQFETLREVGPVGNVLEFVQCPDDVRRKVCLDHGMSSQQYEECLRIAKEWPTLDVLVSKFKVQGDEIVTPGSLVNLQLQIKLGTPSQHQNGSDKLAEEVKMEEKEADDDIDLEVLLGRKSLFKENKAAMKGVHAPLYQRHKKPNWWVFLADLKLDRVIVHPVVLSDIGSDPSKPRNFQITFQAPQQAGLFTFVLELHSDSYLSPPQFREGANDVNVTRNCPLKIEELAALGAKGVENEDEISEPEEDSLAGQMAAMRGEKVKKARSETNGKSESEDSDSGSDSDSSSSDSDSDSSSDKSD